MTTPTQALRTRLAKAGQTLRTRIPILARTPPLERLLEGAARFGYGARGFVYLSIGLLALMATMELTGDAVGSRGAAAWLTQQPFGRVWLVALGVGLWAFVSWRVLQSIFDADRQGTDLEALGTRAGQAVSGIFYGILALAVFELLDEFEPDPGADDVAENQEKAATLLALPFGDWMLTAVGLLILAVGAANVWRGFKSDFADGLACSKDICVKVVPIARAGYVARGLAYLPLGVFVTLAGFRDSAARVTSFGEALDAVERAPGGDWALGLTAVGLMAFGAFAFVEARWRRIRPPRDLSPL